MKPKNLCKCSVFVKLFFKFAIKCLFSVVCFYVSQLKVPCRVFIKPLVSLQRDFSKCVPVVFTLCTHKSTHALNTVIQVMQHTALPVL